MNNANTFFNGKSIHPTTGDEGMIFAEDSKIAHADEARLKEIAKAFARNEQKVVAREIETDILLEELGRRFHAMDIRLNSIKSVIEEG